MIAVTHEAKIHGRPSAERDRLAATVRRARQLARRKQRHRGRR
jgi:hypothetical protein